MIRHEDSQLCYADSVKKDWRIYVVEDDVTLTNENIDKDTITITEDLCTQQDITMGACESSTFEVHVYNTSPRQYKGKTLVVTLVLNGHFNNPIPIGKYKVEEEKLSEDQRVRELKAHDLLYEINNRNVAKWFNALRFPMTIKELRDAFFNYFGIEQEEVNLINDWVSINIEAQNSQQTSKKIDDMEERINQQRLNAIYGVKTSRYVYIDPSSYDLYTSEMRTNWIPIALSGYFLTKDEERVTGKTYYTPSTTYLPVTDATSTDSPQYLGWYEKTGPGSSDYEKSEDTAVDPNKTYYRKSIVYIPVTIYPPHANPKELNWYEKIDEDTSPVNNGWYEFVASAPTLTKDTDIWDYDEQLLTYTDNPAALNLYQKQPDTYTVVVPDPGSIPKAEDWWEQIREGVYQPTTDIEVDPTKTYYIRTEGAYFPTEHTSPQRDVKYYLRRLTSKQYYTKETKVYKSPDLLGWYIRVDTAEIYSDTSDFTFFKAAVQPGDNPQEKGWYDIDTYIYVKTRDSIADTSKDYYEELTTYVAVTPQSGDNPAYNKWFEKEIVEGIETYVPTIDTEVDPTKTYYRKNVDYNKAAVSYLDNPYVRGWFELSNKSFKLTTDVEPASAKTYYIKSAVYDQYDGSFTPATDSTIIEGRDYYIRQDILPKTPTFTKITIPTDPNINPSEEGWWEYENYEYNRSWDKIMVEDRIYYELVAPENDNTAFIMVNTQKFDRDNPKEEGWYEIVNQCYVKTEDTAIDFTKAYFINIYEYNDYAKRNTIVDEIKGSEIIQAICEINGTFGHMNRYGVFRYISLKPIDYSDQGLYPKPDLYPDPNLYPVGAPFDEEIDRSMYSEIEVDDYYVGKINRLVIQKEDNDVGYCYPRNSGTDNYFLTEDVTINQNKDYFICQDPGDDNPRYTRVDTSQYPGANPHEEGWYEYTIYNTYAITGNFIWYGFTDDQITLDRAGEYILTYGVAQISEYRPFKMKASGNPCIEVGDSIKIHTRTGDVYSYVISRTLSGSQRLEDNISAKGNKKRNSKESLYEAVIELKGKSNVLERTIDHTMSKLADLSNGLTSMIEQTVESITLQVSNEIKGLNDKVQEKYQAMTQYTDSKIESTVSREVYDSQMEAVHLWQSQFTMEPTQIMASVESSMPKTGAGNGFKWELTADSFTLSSMGGYKRASNTPTSEDDHERNPYTLGWYIWDTVAKRYDPVGQDHTYVHKDVPYYIANTSGTYYPVFTCNRDGVVVEGTTSSTEFYAELQVITPFIAATEARVGTLETKTAIIRGELNAATADITNLKATAITTSTITSTTIDAANIQGTIPEACITMNTYKGQILDIMSVVATQSDPYEGRIMIGNAALGRLYLIDSSGSSVGTYHQVYVKKGLHIDGQTLDVLCLNPNAAPNPIPKHASA